MGDKALKLTMKTPGASFTVTVPKWMEDRIYSLFITEVKRHAAQVAKDRSKE